MPFTDPETLICPIATIIHQEEQAYITELAELANEQKAKYNDATELINELKQKAIELVALANEIKQKYNDAVDLINELRTKVGITDKPEAQKVQAVDATTPAHSDSQQVTHPDVIV